MLWALNEICNGDKHKMVIPIGNAIVPNSAEIEATGYFSMPNPHVWDRTKNEMILITVGPDTAEFQYDLHCTIFVAFNEVRVVDGQPVLAVLNTLCGKVESILMAIEAEARRVGIVT